MKKAIFIIVALLLPVTSPAYETLRCNNSVIQTGDHKSKVLQSCGEPDMKEDMGTKVYRDANEKRELPVSEWTYIRYQYDIVITFEGGKVVKIENIYK
ncbi:MAG: DUF2845 domain-containing protein [Thermodesulfobacteriota bacterium]